MSAAHDGGTAFPSQAWSDEGAPIYESGLSLRDYFAAKAMKSVIGKCDAFDPVGDAKTHKSISRIAYEIADAMIKARQ